MLYNNTSHFGPTKLTPLGYEYGMFSQIQKVLVSQSKTTMMSLTTMASAPVAIFIATLGGSPTTGGNATSVGNVTTSLALTTTQTDQAKASFNSIPTAYASQFQTGAAGKVTFTLTSSGTNQIKIDCGNLKTALNNSTNLKAFLGGSSTNNANFFNLYLDVTLVMPQDASATIHPKFYITDDGSSTNLAFNKANAFAMCTGGSGTQGSCMVCQGTTMMTLNSLESNPVKLITCWVQGDSAGSLFVWAETHAIIKVRVVPNFNIIP